MRGHGRGQGEGGLLRQGMVQQGGGGGDQLMGTCGSGNMLIIASGPVIATSTHRSGKPRGHVALATADRGIAQFGRISNTTQKR